MVCAALSAICEMSEECFALPNKIMYCYLGLPCIYSDHLIHNLRHTILNVTGDPLTIVMLASGNGHTATSFQFMFSLLVSLTSILILSSHSSKKFPDFSLFSVPSLSNLSYMDIELNALHPSTKNPA